MSRFLLLIICIAAGSAAVAKEGPPRDNMIDGERYPDGYTPMPIKDGVYPRMYTPGTEKLGPKEMRKKGDRFII